MVFEAVDPMGESIQKASSRAVKLGVSRAVRLVTQKVSRRVGIRLLNHLPEPLTSVRVQTEYRGLRLEVQTSEVVGRRIFFEGFFEPAQEDAFIQMLKPRGLVFDIGANIGVYSLLAAQAGCRVVAFEPSQRVRPILEKNIQSNGFGNQIQVVGQAVSDAAGELDFFEGREGNWGVGRIFSFGVRDSGNWEPTRVRTEPLPHYAEQFGAPDMIKMDIEGAELLVLRGGGRVLSHPSAPDLLIELHPGEIEHLGGTVDECLRMLEDHGYSRYTVIKGNSQGAHHWYVFSKRSDIPANFAPAMGTARALQ